MNDGSELSWEKVQQAAVHMEVAMDCIRQGDFDTAIGLLCTAIHYQPDYAEAYSNLGWVFRAKRQFPEAEAALRRAIELNPNLVGAYNNLGLVFDDVNLLEDAETCFRIALEIAPQEPDVTNNLGTVLEDQYRLSEAEAAYRRAIELKPDYAEGYYNLGNLLRIKKCYVEAEQRLLTALEHRPHYPQAEQSLAYLYLVQARYTEGWRQYAEVQKHFPCGKAGHIRNWQGEPLADCRLLLYYDHGLGDTLHFVRYTTIVAPLAAKTVLWVQQPLQALLSAAYPDMEVYAGAVPPPGDFDFACSLPNLPIVFNTQADSIPRHIPYIYSSPALSLEWKRELQQRISNKPYRVGVVWAGNPKNSRNRQRSIPFSLFSQLLDVDGVAWVSLQAGPRSEDAAGTDTLLNLADKLVDYSQTAAVVDNMDVIITVDTSVAHLAGAMGKDTWVLLAGNSDWRWLVEREDTPWYPSMRLFRQQEFGDWAEVFARVRRALTEKVLALRQDGSPPCG